MTATQRIAHLRKSQSLQKAIETKYLPMIYRAIRKYALDLINAPDPSLLLINPYLSDVIKRIYKVAGLANATATRSDLRKTKAANFGTNDEFVQAILEYLSRYLLDKSVKNISETTREWVMEQIREGQAEGLSFQQIARNITGADYLKYQALRVVRTETIRATNVGAVAAMNASPFEVQKEWISAKDKRTRHSHRDLDGQVREMDEDFKPGLGQPGDPRAEAKEVINCRCTVAAVPKRDQNGRLIRKPVAMNPIPRRMLEAV